MELKLDFFYFDVRVYLPKSGFVMMRKHGAHDEAFEEPLAHRENSMLAQ